jgi:diguanylate cyclase (GGDEF)-like protein
LMIKGLLMEQTIRDQANTDSLTGLFNRRAFMAALEADIASGSRFGIALIDLDGFKAVNDGLGHLAGDALLQDVGARLATLCDPRDTVARLGGDEFVVLFRSTATDRAIVVKANEILAALSVSAGATVGPPHVTASLGYAAFPQDGRTATALLAAADDALYAAKAAGKAQAMGYGTRPSQRLVA